MRSETSRYLVVGMITLVIVMLPINGGAVEVTADIAGGIVDKYRTAVAGFESVIAQYAVRLFYSLVTVGLIVGLIKTIMEQGDSSAVVGVFINHAIVAGFFLALIQKWPEISMDIVNSFRRMAGDVSGIDVITPGTLIQSGLEIFAGAVDRVSMWSPAVSTGMILVAFVVLMVYALISAIFTMALIEMYFMLSVGVFFIAFGGLVFSRQFAINQIKYPLMIGAKLFVIQILAGIGATLVEGMVNPADTTFTDLAAVAVAAVILLFLVKEIPTVVSSMISGETFTGGVATNAAIGGAVGAAAGGAVGAAGAAVAGATAISAAVEMAKHSNPGGSKAQLTKDVVKNLASGVTGEASRTLMAQPKSNQGSYWGRAAQSLQEAAKEAAKKK